MIEHKVAFCGMMIVTYDASDDASVIAGIVNLILHQKVPRKELRFP